MGRTEAGNQAWELFFELFRRHRAHMRELQQRFDLAPMDLHALRALTPTQSMPAGQLAGHIFCDPPNIVKVVARLVERGLVTQTRDEVDGRVRQVRLTREGALLRDEVIEAFAVPPTYISGLPDGEQQLLRDLLQHMLSASVGTDEAVTAGSDPEP